MLRAAGNGKDIPFRALVIVGEELRSQPFWTFEACWSGKKFPTKLTIAISSRPDMAHLVLE